MSLLIFLCFYGCLKLRFPDVEENPGPRTVPRDKCRIMFSIINGLHGHLEDLAVAASGLDIVVCAETMVSGRRHVAELLILGFSSPTMLLRGNRPNGLDLALYACSGLSVLNSVGSSVPAVNIWFLSFLVDYLIFYLFYVHKPQYK